MIVMMKQDYDEGLLLGNYGSLRLVSDLTVLFFLDGESQIVKKSVAQIANL